MADSEWNGDAFSSIGPLPNRMTLKIEKDASSGCKHSDLANDV